MKSTFNILKIFLFISTMMFTNKLYSQTYMQEKRIYLVDVTASMTGKGNVKTPDIFSKVKEGLLETINNINNPSTEIIIVPFTNKPHEKMNGQIMAKNGILESIKSLTIKPGDTNIADAWNYAIQEIDSTRINYIFLLTDGLHNCGPEKDSLYNNLRKWADISKNKYYFAFYVMLTPNAKEQEICNIVDETQKMWLIESMNVNVSFLTSNLEINTNVKNKKTTSIHYDSNNPAIFNDSIDFNLTLNENPYYSIENFKLDMPNKKVSFDLKELQPTIKIPIETTLELKVNYDMDKYPMLFFTPDTYKFNVVNKGIREMTIKEK